LSLYASLRSLFFALSLSLRVLHSFPTRRSSDLSFLETRNTSYLYDDLRQFEHFFYSYLEKNNLTNGPIGLHLSSSDELLFLIARSEEHTSELQSRFDLVCRLLLEKKKQYQTLS